MNPSFLGRCPRLFPPNAFSVTMDAAASLEVPMPGGTGRTSTRKPEELDLTRCFNNLNRKWKEGTRRALRSLLPKLQVKSVLDCSCGLTRSGQNVPAPTAEAKQATDVALRTADQLTGGLRAVARR